MAKKRALGRGLDALLGAEPEPQAAEGARTLPIERLRPNRLQPRSDFAPDALADLVQSIREQGVIQPLVVSPLADGEYTIVAGERRWRAAQQAGLDEVPVVVREVENDRDLLETALVENLQRSDLNPVEEAEAYRRLQEEFGLTQETIARRVGKSRPTVANALRLLQLPERILGMMREGRLTAGQARPLLAIEGEDERLRLASRAADGGLSARQLEALAKRGARSRKRRPTPDADTRAAAERLTRRLQTRVDIQRSGRGGSIRIAFHSEEELMRLFELLTKAGSR